MSNCIPCNNEVMSTFRRSIQDDVAIPVAAMNTLVNVIVKSKATTWMGLEEDLRAAIAVLRSCSLQDLGGRSNISVGPGCDIFMKYVSRAFSLEAMVSTSFLVPS